MSRNSLSSDQKRYIEMWLFNNWTRLITTKPKNLPKEITKDFKTLPPDPLRPKKVTQSNVNSAIAIVERWYKDANGNPLVWPWWPSKKVSAVAPKEEEEEKVSGPIARARENTRRVAFNTAKWIAEYDKRYGAPTEAAKEYAATLLTIGSHKKLNNPIPSKKES